MKMSSLMIGRFQPLHEGHVKLIRKVMDEGKKVCIALKDTEIDENNPYSIEERKEMFYKEFGDKVDVIVIPDVCEVVYGRNVGYKIRKIKLDKKTEEISATKIRNSSKC